ncbi:MAG TPA: ECF-type sigma factor [Steroidobacteraceae bacterium]|nr:ECF-type sigma factor [Steroidobacteraceae bacterium]
MEAQQQLFTLLYSELHRIASRELRRHAPGLSATTLLHEAYLSLHEKDPSLFPDRAHFVAYASRVMRGLVIDFARNRRTLKRGGEFHITALPVNVPDKEVDCTELERLNEALERLARIEPRLAQVVDLKYFSGFSFGDIASMWGVCQRTVQRDWEKARLFLHRAMLAPANGSDAMSQSDGAFRLPHHGRSEM